jgi:hypothetical protein
VCFKRDLNSGDPRHIRRQVDSAAFSACTACSSQSQAASLVLILLFGRSFLDVWFDASLIL